MSTENKSPQKVELSDAKRQLLAQRLKGAAAEIQLQTSNQIQHVERAARMKISVDQYRIWLHSSVQPDAPKYNEPITIQHHGFLDVDLLQRSLNHFVLRHEAWRTSFHLEQGEVLQQVHKSVSVSLKFFDLSTLPHAERETQAKALATQQALQPIALDQAPLFRSLVVKVSADEYRLYMVLHHIIFDGLSIQETFIPELASIYNAYATGAEPELSLATLQYSDYAEWREQQIASPRMETHLDYWKKQLEGELPLLRLPTDRERSAQTGQAGAIECFTISKELTDSLRVLSRTHGASLYMIMLAAFKVLLFRYSGQEDIIVGTGVDGRRLPELRRMMGYILDTFAVRTRPSSKTTFVDYLEDVKQSTLGGMAAAEIPFDRVVNALGLKRERNQHPIFQVFFSFLAPSGDLPEGWEMLPKNINTGAAKFDIYLEVEERPTHTPACFIYNADLLNADTMKRMAGHWITLLEAVSQAPQTALGVLPLLTPEEQELMLVRWNDQPMALPETTLHGLVEQQAARTPDSIAVTFDGRFWTYAELDAVAERFAFSFAQAGAGPDTLVAICIERSEYLVAGLLGILKTGAAYLPLDPGTPQARIALCLEDANPAVVLTHRNLLPDLRTAGAKVLVLEDLLEQHTLSPQDIFRPAVEVSPEDPAYVIHTSGSTGRPKAVELRHHSVVNLLLSMQRKPGFADTDVLVAVTTISFDIAVLELFLPLVTGGRVVIASREVALDPWALAQLMDGCGCTVMQATPSTWRMLLATDWAPRRSMRALCGGEAMPRDLANNLLALNLELWNVYGPTETTIWSTAQRVARADAGPVPVGRPIANTTTYILDANQQPVPIGVPGELYIGGAGVANGYRGQPALTAEKFVRPSVARGEVIYRTGDNAVYRADGTIECRGRADNQVKIRGHRIELEEVELHLHAHPQIASAAARVWVDPTGSNRISAYVVGKAGVAPSAAEMRDFLAARVAEYMIPSDFTVLDSLPLTPNGKTDRKALPQPDHSAILQSESTEEVSPEEQSLLKIWASTLGLPSVGRNDNFFDLGGHSLLLILLFARINKEFGSSLPITTIFDAQTPAGLFKALKEKTRMSSLVPVQTSGTKPPLFMAHSYLLYHSLSSGLGNDQPFYGLRESEEDSGLSIEQRALQYIADMRRVQPQGPYRIAGLVFRRAARSRDRASSHPCGRAGRSAGVVRLMAAGLRGKPREA